MKVGFGTSDGFAEILGDKELLGKFEALLESEGCDETSLLGVVVVPLGIVGKFCEGEEVVLNIGFSVSSISLGDSDSGYGPAGDDVGLVIGLEYCG